MWKKDLSNMIDHLTDCLDYDHAIIIVGKRKKGRIKAEIMTSTSSIRELKMLLENSTEVFINQIEEDDHEEEEED